MVKEVLISGSSGFVGSNFREYIKDYPNIEVRRLVRSINDFNASHDILWNDLKELPNSTNAIIHLAGMAHDLKNTNDASIYFEINTKLTIKLFNLFLASNASKFIFVSSVKAAADSLNGVLTEETECVPFTPYGQSKYKAELAIMDLLVQYNESHPTQVKTLFILRPCMIHGPGNKGNLNLLYQLIKKGIPYPLGAFNNQRSYLSIQNLCFVLEKLLNGNFPGGIFNLADDAPLSTNDLIHIMADAQGKKSRIWNFPKSFIQFVAKLGDKLHLPLNSDRLQKLTESYVVDNSKIKSLLKTTFPISARQGLVYTFKSFN